VHTEAMWHCVHSQASQSERKAQRQQSSRSCVLWHGLWGGTCCHMYASHGEVSDHILDLKEALIGWSPGWFHEHFFLTEGEYHHSPERRQKAEDPCDDRTACTSAWAHTSTHVHIHHVMTGLSVQASGHTHPHTSLQSHYSGIWLHQGQISNQ